MDNLSLVLASVALLIAVAALTVGCVATAFIVGLKNSTHKIEWKTIEAPQGLEDDIQDEIDGEPMMEKNPNKRIKRNEPFTPFPDTTPKEEEPFFDEDDPNNTSHDY